MKKTLFAALLVLITTSVFSQVNKGQWMVGGNASFESQKFSEGNAGSVSQFQLMPNAGYFFIDKLAGGLRVELNSIKEEDEDAVSMFSVSPFVRYYFLPAAQRTNIFADASYGFGTAGAGDKESFNQFSIMAGPAFFLTPNVALEIALRYRSAGGDLYGNDGRLNGIGAVVGFQVHLGRGGTTSR